MQQSDRKLLVIIKDYLNDMLENTYNALINEVFRQIKAAQANSTEFGAADFDNFHFFKFSAFMIEVTRLKAYENQKNQAKLAQEQAKN